MQDLATRGFLQQATTDETTANKAASRALLEDVLGKGRYDLLQSVLVPDPLVHGPFTRNPAAHRRSYQDVGDDTEALFTGFPDWEHQICDQLAEGDKVVTYSTVAGTQTGPFLGIAAAGRRVRVAAVTVDTFVGGRISERWVTVDTALLLQQLGARPTIGAADPFVSTRDAPPLHSVSPWRPVPARRREDNKATVAVLYKAVTAEEPRGVRGLLSQDFVNHASAAPGRAGFLSWVSELHGVLGEASVQVDDMVAEGEWVAVRLDVTGIHAGRYLDLAPTGKRVRVGMLATWRVIDGRLMEVRNLVDAHGLLRQLGATR